MEKRPFHAVYLFPDFSYIHPFICTLRESDVLDILNDIRQNVTLIHLMDSLENVNNDISIAGNWIFDSKYKK